jgi:rhodanese-related sulfurtransferase
MHPHQIPMVDPREVGDDYLLDVREDDEWTAGRAPGAVHVPLHTLPDRLPEVPTGRPISVVCRMGGRSAQATAWLVAQGYPARNVQGGMQAWASLGLPLVGDDALPRVI